MTRGIGIIYLPTSRTFNTKKRIVKDKLSTIPTGAKRSNVLNANILDIFKLNAQVFQGNKEESPMSLMMKKVNLIKLTML